MQSYLDYSGHRANESVFITQLALEQKADAVFFITGYHRGFDDVLAPASKKQIREFEKLKASRDYQKQLAKHKLEVPQMEARVKVARPIYTRFFKGKNRIIRGEDETKSARSSKGTKKLTNPKPAIPLSKIDLRSARRGMSRPTAEELACIPVLRAINYLIVS